MGLRETLNRRPGVAAGVVAALIAVAIGVTYWENRPAAAGPNADTGKIHFTIDDGATWFAESVDKYPQFKKDGKDAYRANVFRDAEGKEFVAYLERRATQSSAEAAAQAATTADQLAVDATAVTTGVIEVKRPGEKIWYRDVDPRAQEIMRPRSPSGKTDGLTYVQAR